MSLEGARRCVHSLGSGDKRLHHFSICGDRAPLLLRRGQRAEGGNKVQVSRLAIGHRAGCPRATLTGTRMMHPSPASGPPSASDPRSSIRPQSSIRSQSSIRPSPTLRPSPHLRPFPSIRPPTSRMRFGSPNLAGTPEHTQAAPEQQDNSSGRRCIFRNHLRSSSSWRLFQVKERQRKGTCAGGSGGCVHVPQLCFLPVGALLSCSLTGPRVVSFQIHGLLDISSPSPELRPSPVWQRAGNTQAQGLKGSQGDSRAPASGRAGDEGGRPQRAPEQHWKESGDA